MAFIGREKELQTIRGALSDSKTKSILVYGRRRIGKTTLINEALKEIDGVKAIYRGKVQEAAKSIAELSALATAALGMTPIAFPSLDSLFAFLSSREERIVLVLDEYQDMRKLEGEYVDALLRNAMEDMGENVKIIISGSAIRIMKQLLTSENPLYGRFKAEIFVGEMDYYDAAKFYPSFSARDKIVLFSVFGGIPWIIESIDETQSVEENIKKLMIDEKGIARTYVDNVIGIECSEIAYGTEVFRIIRNGKKRFSEIQSNLNMESSRSQLARTLKTMLDAELIKKRCPINSTSRKTAFYEVTSNILRFYFAYQDALLDENAASIENLYRIQIEPSLLTYVSYRFEDICRGYFKRLSNSGVREDIFRIGTYWYDDPKARKNGEFDVAIERVDGSYEIYECKFLKEKASEALVLEEKKKVFRAPLSGAIHFGFVSSSGFEKKEIADVLMVSGEDLFQ